MWKGLEQFEPEPSYEGFVYIIKRISTGEWYLGKKSFWSRVKETKKSSPKFGKKVTKESNWKIYQSSSDVVSKWPEDDIEKVCLRICKSKYELSYYELFYLFKTEGLRKTLCLNYMAGSSTIGKCPDYMLIEE
ncbi:TPA: hypothetical protein RQN07_002759 [Aeromonas dhakensis]|uniref:hypothetical protein n=1 Tax=Aeromonas dhakensis TaxID=196024 RepID=UPI00288D661E|nr:hypothetical protein [Aeromonas dhakensis]HDX8469027.1 hypothetical protein [Aeromonas dhakensis]HDZ8869542.1 hypothetical protein [Aeromonas dhakensis]HDZ8931162.1 hypothetical protein [Aeromonas dhakensis]HEA3208368.1 hypothetical protein [Aeromonas dhakensis]